MKPSASQLTDPAILQQLFNHNLNRMYFGKRYLNDNMPHLIETASFRTLQLALGELQGDVKKQLGRLEEIYRLAGITPSSDECIPIKSIFKETFALEKKGIGLELLGDIDMILYMQLIEHINITAFRMLLILSKALNFTEISQLLIESFDESVDDDHLFTMIANEYLGRNDQVS